MKRFRRIIAAALLGMVGWTLQGQEVDFSVRVQPAEVQVGQPFRVEFTYNRRGRFTPPEFGDLQVLAGPNTSTRWEWINGRMSSSYTISYVLRAAAPGEYRIGRAKLEVRGREYYTEPVTVRVVGSAARHPPPAPGGTPPPSAADSLPEVFIRAVVNKRSPYEGEAVGVSYYLYTRVPIQDYAVTHLPTFSEFFTYEVPLRNPAVQRTEIKGRPYRYVKLYEAVVFPLRSGKLKIPPLKVDAVALIPRRVVRRYRSPFADFWGDDPFFRQFFEEFERMWEDYSYEQKLLHLQSESVTLNVRPLPVKGRTPDFSGLVGRFTMEVALDSPRISPGGVATLTVRIQGEGNIKMVDVPMPDFPAGLEVFPPETKASYRVRHGKVTGQKTFRFALEARQPGTYRLPPIRWSYFDPERERYVSLSSDTLVLHVQGTPPPDSVVVGARPAVPADDIAFIYRDVRRWYRMAEWRLPEGWGVQYAGGMGGVLVLMGLGWALRRRYERRGGLWMRREAARMAAIRRKARRALQQGDAAELARAVTEGFQFLFEWKLHLPPAELTSDVLRKRLTPILPPDDAEAVIEAWTTAQMEAVRPTLDDAQRRKWWHTVDALWRRLEKTPPLNPTA